MKKSCLVVKKASSFNMFQPVKQNNLPKIEKTETRPLEMRAEQTQTHAQP